MGVERVNGAINSAADIAWRTESAIEEVQGGLGDFKGGGEASKKVTNTQHLSHEATRVAEVGDGALRHLIQ